jgi:hypothetical protein
MGRVAPTRMPEASQQVAGGRAQRYHRIQIQRPRASRQGCQPSARRLTHSIDTRCAFAPPREPRGLDGDPTEREPKVGLTSLLAPYRSHRCCDLWPRPWHPSGMLILFRIGFPAVSQGSTAGYGLESLRDEGRDRSRWSGSVPQGCRRHRSR